MSVFDCGTGVGCGMWILALNPPPDRPMAWETPPLEIAGNVGMDLYRWLLRLWERHRSDHRRTS